MYTQSVSSHIMYSNNTKHKIKAVDSELKWIHLAVPNNTILTFG